MDTPITRDEAARVLREAADEMLGPDAVRLAYAHERPRYGCRCDYCADRRRRATVLRWAAGQLTARKAEKEAASLRTLLGNLCVSCGDVSHRRGDYHELGDPCPVEARIAAAIAGKDGAA